MWKSYAFCIRTVCILSISFLSGHVIAMQDEGGVNESDRLKIGLVLSGGGARGAAHVGVLKVLEENRIPVDVISGTSFGAIVGGLYAAGYSADELEEILENIDWKESLSGRAPRDERSFKRKQDDDGFLIKFKIGIKDGELRLPNGLITPNNLRLTLQDLVNEISNVDDFDDLAIPFRAVATDLETGMAVVLERGNLASAMVASMAVPALFPPIEHDGRLLVDGGVSNNVPVNVARAMGADIVIVVDISTPMMSKDDIESFTSVIDQLMLIMTNRNSAAQLATSDQIKTSSFALNLMTSALLILNGRSRRCPKAQSRHSGPCPNCRRSVFRQKYGSLIWTLRAQASGNSLLSTSSESSTIPMSLTRSSGRACH